MKREQFWAMVEAGRARDAGDPCEGLRGALIELAADELVSFQQHFDELFDAAYQWKLWGAAYLIEGGCSDDGFIDFRYGLISLGRAVYEAALKDPDSLAAIDDEIPDESFGYVACELFDEKGEGEMERGSRGPSEPAGEEWDFDDDDENRRRLPSLHARFGHASR